MKNDKDKCVNAKCDKKAVKDNLCEKHNKVLEGVADEELVCGRCGKVASEVKVFIKKRLRCANCVRKDKKDKKDTETSGPSLPDAAAVKDQASEKDPRPGKSRGTNKDVVDAVPSSATAPSIEESIKCSEIDEISNEVKAMILEKNRLYGNSVFNPIRAFSKADKFEQLYVRIDDKISRLRSSQLDDKEDVIKDLIGYLTVLLIAQRR